MNKEELRAIGLAVMMLLLLLLTGCSNMLLGKTEAHFVTPEGLKGDYVSSKNQENFAVVATVGPDGKIRSVTIHTTSTTPESAIAAMAQLYAQMFQEIKDLTAKLAAAGAGS
jgi:hypothetical protein